MRAIKPVATSTDHQMTVDDRPMVERQETGTPMAVVAILAELRRELRRLGIAVRDAAARLGVAEPTARRWLRGRGLTLDGLARLCAILDMDMRDLIARSGGDGPARFTLAQERTLAADRGLALVFFAVLNGAQRADLDPHLGLAPERLDSHLDRLQRLSLVTIAPGGRLRPLVARGVRWLDGGPLATAFDRTVKHHVLTMDYGAAEARYVSDMVRLSPQGRARVHAMLMALREDVHLLAEQERAAGRTDLEWSALFLLVRPLDMAGITAGLR